MSGREFSDFRQAEGTTFGESDERPTARLGDITFDKFQQPQLVPSGSARTVSHDVLPESEDDDRATVVQSIGREAQTFTLRGTTLEETVGALQDLIGQEVGLRHSLFSGRVLVKSVEPESLEGARDRDGYWYTYRATLVEVVG